MASVFRAKYPASLHRVITHAERLHDVLRRLENGSPPPHRALVGRASELRVLLRATVDDWQEGRRGEADARDAIARHVDDLHRTAAKAIGTGRRLECCRVEDPTPLAAITTASVSLPPSAVHELPGAGPTEQRCWGDSSEVLARFHGGLDLVDQVARGLATRISSFRATFDELRAWGLEGLLEASRRFDPQRGVPFTWWARHGIRRAMLDGVRGAAVGAARDPSRLEFVQPDPTPVASPEKMLGDAEERALLPALLNGLPAEERRLLERYYLGGESLAQAAAALGLAPSTASRMHGRALASLRRQLRPDHTP